MTEHKQLEMLFEAVKLMRQKQKEYFRTRSRSTLIESKEAEMRVDTLIKIIEEPILFD